MNKNHAVCIPMPAQGHIRPMLKLAKLLHFNFGFHITFINTYHNHQTLFQQSHQAHSSSSSSSSCKSPIFRFESIPDCTDDPKDNMSVLNSFLDDLLEAPLKELLLKLGSKECNQDLSPTKPPRLPPVTCMVTDVGMSKYTLDVAGEMGIPAVSLETSGACGMMGYLQTRQLLDKGIIPLRDSSCLTNGYLDMAIDWIPSLKGIRLKNMPTSIRTIDQNDKLMNHVMSSEYRALKSRAILINTFDTLEQDVLKELSSFSPNIYPIGPLNLLVNNKPKDDNIGLTLSCEEDIDYIQWLDSQVPNSVLYVSLGTLAMLTQEQLVELAWGLANSHQKFIWVVRSNLCIGGSKPLSLEFEEEIKERGILLSWCDQEKVLGHSSVGGFVTHCGWNSMIESISNGVPMICWPFFADQGTNGWYCCNYLGLGIDMSEVIKRDQIERMIIELMEGNKGKDMKKRAIEWRKLAKKAAMNLHGSSYANLESIVNNVLLSNDHIVP
ncbi:7-deoxyloganetin glucosyltransferase [Beta vulgaris subsp. vulgaris]|uniref:7-deoxyloganetin glucosyltransferase n=1 Tax=Beta vulgaris subsp. vulgaris TaxID=3555 RepID=UPI00203761F2|nr:7-deoxyloganetin glucosyltransferase [Beta vulgaris subsp. vulgaris]